MFKLLLTNPSLMSIAGKKSYQEMAYASTYMSIPKLHKAFCLDEKNSKAVVEPGSLEYSHTQTFTWTLRSTAGLIYSWL